MDLAVSLPPLPSLPEARQPAVDAGLGAIVAADRGFDRFRFMEMTRSRFATVKQAVVAWQPESCRSLMTPSLYQAWSAQVRDLEARRIRNVFGDLQVADPQVMWVDAGPQTQHITVQLNAMSVHFAFLEGSRQLLFGDDQEMRAFTEYWTFSRPAGAQTGDASQPTRCPVCGAPVQPGDALCAYCKNAAPQAASGWLISRMDEELVWQDGG